MIDQSHKATRVESFCSAREAGQRVRLGKRTSNLFRRGRADGSRTLDVSGFNTVIAVEPAARKAEVGGMTPYDAVVAATLRHGLMPAVVPELKSITVYRRSYERWFQALYQDKYLYMGDFDFMRMAMILDIGGDYFGVVRSVYFDGSREFLRLVLSGGGADRL